MSFTWTGTRLRFWAVGPRGYSSSRLINLEIWSHYDLFVEWIVFCVGLPDRVLPRWEPSHQMKISRPLLHPSDPWTSKDVIWTPVAGAGKNGLLEARVEPIGTRTAVWAGQLASTGAVPKAVVMKASWLTPDIVKHEYKILHKLQYPASSEAFPGLLDRRFDPEEMPGWDYVRENLPKPYGQVAFATETRHVEHPSVNASAPLSETKDVILSVLVMEGEAAIDLEEIEELTMCQLIRIFIDVVIILEYLSYHGFHYRDLNLGNIMVKKIVAASGEVSYRGVLVDFGNTIFAGQRHLVAESVESYAAACKDDGRSANPYFMCLNSHRSRVLADSYTAATIELAQSAGRFARMARLTGERKDYWRGGVGPGSAQIY